MNLAGTALDNASSVAVMLPSGKATVSETLEAAVSRLSQQGHTVRSWVACDGWPWFEIDGTRLASWLELQGLENGSYTLAEMEEVL